jgi:AraC family transcriptional regulator
MATIGIPAVDAYRSACNQGPLLVRDSPSHRKVGLYGWRTGLTKEVHIAETRELIPSVHLGGARRVRVFTEQGLSQSFSRPGDITLIPSGQPISYRTDGEVEFATVHFPLAAAASHSNDLLDALSNLQVCLFARHDDYVISSVKLLMQASQSMAHGSAQYFAAVFEALSCHVARIIKENGAEQLHLARFALPAATGPDFDEVIRQIEARLSEKIMLQDLADIAGVGRTTFAEQFSKRFGCSPHKFITQRRIEKAKDLLRQGHLNVTDIAYEVGFSSQSHFSTTFRALTGFVPTTYSADLIKLPGDRN